MQVFHEKECEILWKICNFDVLICAKGFKFVKISVFTFEKNIFIIKILV